MTAVDAASEQEVLAGLGALVAHHHGDWTGADYLALPEGTRAELHDGRLILSPSPTPRHQFANVELAVRFRDLVPSDDLVLIATDVQLVEHERYRTPDLVVLREWTHEHPIPARDVILVAEIVSSKGGEEYTHKLEAYRDAGIEWYLLLVPDVDGYAGELLRLDGQAYITSAKSAAGSDLELPAPWNAVLPLGALRPSQVGG